MYVPFSPRTPEHLLELLRLLAEAPLTESTEVGLEPVLDELAHAESSASEVDPQHVELLADDRLLREQALLDLPESVTNTLAERSGWRTRSLACVRTWSPKLTSSRTHAMCVRSVSGTSPGTSAARVASLASSSILGPLRSLVLLRANRVLGWRRGLSRGTCALQHR